jgi:succinate dehydrogenase (ubiquinone) cytochrome b560 subunit
MPFRKTFHFRLAYSLYLHNTNLTYRVYSGVPEYWGRDSPYHPGTDFLGTPKNHLDLVAKRPLSPHVFEIDHKHMHYKMPLTAISSILNRVTGVMMSAGFGGVALLSLKSGDVGALIASYKAAYPLLVYPAKFAIAFPLAYHYLAAVRHMYWDHYKYGNMIDKNSPLELPNIQASSKAVVLGGAALAAGLAVYSI